MTCAASAVEDIAGRRRTIPVPNRGQPTTEGDTARPAGSGRRAPRGYVRTVENWTAVVFGGPSFVGDALRSMLGAHGFTVAESVPSSPPDRLLTVAVILCTDTSGWEMFDEIGDGGVGAVVVVIDRLDPKRYARAFARGAGVVHLDSPEETIVDVIRARMRGEILAPVGCVAALLDVRSDGFTEAERALLDALVRGDSVQQMAADIGYSERTVRRRLQSLYFRLNVQNRLQAVERVRAEHS